MKKTLITFLLTLSFLSSFSQIIHPDEIRYIVTDEDLSENKVLTFNDFFLFGLEFERVSDTLYINRKTNEKMILTAFEKENKIHAAIDYFTDGNHWSDFKKSLKDFNITHLTANTFIAEYKPYKEYKIELLGEGLGENNKQKHLRFSFHYSPHQSGEPFFPLLIQYPFRYSTWYFDIKIFDTEEKETYAPVIMLTKEVGKNKIEFLDRENFLISYIDEQNHLQKIKGRHGSYEHRKGTAIGVSRQGFYSRFDGRPGIYFRLENASVIFDKLHLNEKVEFSELSTKDLVEFIFNMDFNIAKIDEGFLLRNKIEIDAPIIDVKPE